MNRQQKRQGYVLAIVVSVVVLAARYMMGGPLGDHALLLPFVLAVIVAAWRGGFGPGIVATVAGTMLSASFLMSPFFSSSLHGYEYMLVFIVVGVIISYLCEALHAARRREGENQFQMLADSIPQLVWMARPDGFRFWFNQQWYAYSGATPGKLDGNGWEALLDPAETSRVTGRWKSAVEAGQIWEDTFQLRRRDGQMHWFLGRAVPIRDDQGDVVRWFGAITDISKRKTMELELRELNDHLEQRVAERTEALERQAQELIRSEQELATKSSMLKSILDAAPDAIVTIDRRGIMQSVNRATELLFGYADHELVGQNVSMLMPPPFRDEHDGYIARFLCTGEARVIGIGREVLARRKDGSIFSADLAVSEVDHLGYFTGIVRDVSERKELQREVLEIAAEEDQRIGRELHDNIQQQLTGLGLLAHNLTEKLANKSLEEAEIAARIARGIRDSSNDVHLLSHGLFPVDVDTEGLRAALMNLSVRMCEQFGVPCTFTCENQVDVADNFVATHLFRIVQEAVTNAIKHGHAHRIDISLTGTGKAALLSVFDDGIGMSDNEYRGPGTGLRIMRHRASLIGAAIQIRSTQEGGTEVQCRLGLHDGYGNGGL